MVININITPIDLSGTRKIYVRSNITTKNIDGRTGKNLIKNKLSQRTEQVRRDASRLSGGSAAGEGAWLKAKRSHAEEGAGQTLLIMIKLIYDNTIFMKKGILNIFFFFYGFCDTESRAVCTGHNTKPNLSQ